MRNRDSTSHKYINRVFQKLDSTAVDDTVARVGGLRWTASGGSKGVSAGSNSGSGGGSAGGDAGVAAGMARPITVFGAPSGGEGPLASRPTTGASAASTIERGHK